MLHSVYVDYLNGLLSTFRSTYLLLHFKCLMFAST
uniref:Uncharacterized protein n=1 Tax=Arundo donax TaxID=35708 RepID=A0A0A9GYR1_ARUDO